MNDKRAFILIASTACLAFVAYTGCGSDGETATGAGPGAGGATSGTESGSGGSIFVGSGGNGSGGDENCASVSQEATLQSRPVDIIVTIDNSGSMGGEIEEVEVQITRNFAAILDAAVPAIDYRVIMVAQHGEFSGEDICIAQPLGAPADVDMDGHCDDVDDPPTDTTKFFHHSTFISSHNALCRLRQQFDAADDFDLHPNGYKDLLRDDSYKFFLVITDDNPTDSQQNGCNLIYDDNQTVNGGITAAASWDADMLALSPLHFGTDTARNYTFWSIVALAPYMPTAMDPYGVPHPPDTAIAPIITAECDSGAEHSGTGYQALSVLTGGYRFPTCAADELSPTPSNYDALFTLMAQGVIEGAQVDCEIAIPDPPPGQTVDLNTLTVDYESPAGTPVSTFTQVANLADCNADSFYIEDNTIKLCPEACGLIQADENAKLTVAYDCGVPPQ